MGNKMTKGYHTPRKKKTMPDESGSFSHRTDRLQSGERRKKRGKYF
jgi:hypothetical protein